MQRLSAIRELVARQHGVIARRQLLAIGLSAGGIDHWVRNERLVVVRRGVYALGHAELRRQGHVLAAVLAVGDDAVLSHRSAARQWGLRPWSGTFVEISVPSRRGIKVKRDLRVHNATDLHPWEITEDDGIPLTTPARTLLDLAAVVPPHQLRRAVERAEQLEIYDHVAVLRVLAAHPRRPGSPALKALLADLQAHGTTSMTRSDLEALFLQLCLDHDLPRPQVNRYDNGRELDFRWPERRVAVETNGFWVHRTRDAFERDHVRRLELEAAGWRVISLTWRQVTRRPHAIAEHVRSTLAETDRT
jgi:very-short-patch-repair endonuclease